MTLRTRLGCRVAVLAKGSPRAVEVIEEAFGAVEDQGSCRRLSRFTLA
jgi:hypothetical protein